MIVGSQIQVCLVLHRASTRVACLALRFGLLSMLREKPKGSLGVGIKDSERLKE